MLKLWPQSPYSNDLTPRASHQEKNPFDDLIPIVTTPSPSLSPVPTPIPNTYPTTPTGVHPLLAVASPLSPNPSPLPNPSPMSSAYAASVPSDLTPLASPGATAAICKPTTHLSLHAPFFNFNMQQPPAPKSSSGSSGSRPGSTRTSPAGSSSIGSQHTNGASPSTTTASTTSSSSSSRGQIHVKLIQARGLAVKSVHARPYVVVQFEQNEFVSRDPIEETEREVKGRAVNLGSSNAGSANISRQASSSAINALNGIQTSIHKKRNGSNGSNGKGSKDPSPSSSLLSSVAKTLGHGASQPDTTMVSNSLSTTPTHTNAHTHSTSTILGGGLFSRLSAHNPVWKHEVSFDVTSSDSLVTFTVYDRSLEDQGFLGTIQIKPVLVHDHTVDQWFKLEALEDDHANKHIVSGEMRVQITYEQFKTKRALMPRDFEFLKLIGRGTFGKVFQVRKKDTHRIYAMKVLSKKEIIAKKEVAHTIGERKILQSSLESPFLVGLKFSFQTERELYLVTDFKSGGELFWHLQRETRFTEERAKFYIAELILALEHLHKYNIVYRDLKPENILLDATGHVALCDFGLSKADLRPDELTTTFCGTTEYLAPEILLDEQGYSKIVDFWSLGVLLFEMCCGWSPFYAEDTQQMYKNICFGKIRFPKGVINEEGKQFVKGLLNRNPKHRLGAHRDAAELKEHAYFKNIDWVALSLKQIAPPFKPVVESDESTNNFDPEFTNADVRDVGWGGPDDDEDEGFGEEEEGSGSEGLDEDDPSERWVESVSVAMGEGKHMPMGPLGSEKAANATGGGGHSYVQANGVLNGIGGLSSYSGTNGINGHANGHGSLKNGTGLSSVKSSTAPSISTATASASASGTATPTHTTSDTTTPKKSTNIQIKKPKAKKSSPLGSPLTNSVQEKFRGFTYHGGESLAASMHMHANARRRVRGEKDDDHDEVVADEDGPGGTTEDEYEDFEKSAGRIANERKKAVQFGEMDEVI